MRRILGGVAFVVVGGLIAAKGQFGLGLIVLMFLALPCLVSGIYTLRQRRDRRRKKPHYRRQRV